ncbi:kinase-like protein, partial [Dentipellis sp. KUC8613]
PNVLRLLGVVHAPHAPLHTVTVLCRRGSLVRCLRDARDLQEPDLLQMMCDVAAGLEYLHGKGIAHGNLQGENVLVQGDFNCVIGGFMHSGLAATSERDDSCQYALQDRMLAWYAPEVLGGGDPFRRKADMYSFAMVCVEILRRGGAPWPRASRQAMRANVL